jgi:hypothetical protein
MAGQLARRVEGRVEYRAEPSRVGWQLDSVVSSDRHELTCTFECAARIADNPTDQRTAQQVLLSDRDVATAAQLVERMRGGVASAAADFVSKLTIAEILTDQCRQSMLDALTKRANAAAFACGVELVGPYRLDLHSGSFTRQQLDAVEHARREERANQRLAQFKRAGELLKEFDTIRAATPSASASAILENLRADDRGETLESLLYASAHHAQQTSTLWAVSGKELVRIDPRAQPPAIEVVGSLTALGPLRSVRDVEIDSKPMLLIGAESGIYVADPARLNQAVAYHDDPLQNHAGVGFNDVIVWQNRLYATHGTAGVVAWSLDNSAAPAFAVRPTQLPIGTGAARVGGPRNPCAVGNDLFFSAHNNVLRVNSDVKPESVATTDSAAILIVALPTDLLILTSDGAAHRLDPRTLRITRDERRFAPSCAAAMLPWVAGEQRIVLATESGSVQCVGLDDSVVTEYAGGRRNFRMVSAKADLVAAVTEDRQRILIWNSWDGRAPIGEIYVTGLTRHRIADLQFA